MVELEGISNAMRRGSQMASKGLPSDMDDYIVTSSDVVYYHVTRSSNVPRILREGLGRRHSGGLSAESRVEWGERGKGRVHLSGNIGSVLGSLAYRKEAVVPTSYTILEVRVPGNTRLYEDEDRLQGGWCYAKVPIPPSLIQVVGAATLKEGKVSLGNLPPHLRCKVGKEVREEVRLLREWD